MKSPISSQLWFEPGINGLPYELPIHPNLVHFTIGLFIIAIVFDLAGTFFPLDRPILKTFGFTALRSGFYHVGWYNLLASAIITFFTVAMGFFELVLANPPTGEKSAWGLAVGTTMVLHGLGGIFLLAAIVAMTVWRGLQRYHWRSNKVRQVQWLYLLGGIAIMLIMYIQGTLGAQLGDEFGIHTTAADLLRQGKNPNVVLK